jgi:ABC-type antimicrobial peptide transport system permease subunit
LTDAVAVETSGSIGIIIGVIVGVIIALVLALVFMRRRRHLNEKRRKSGGLQVPNGREAQHDGRQVPNVREANLYEKGGVARRAKAESADEMAAPEPKPTGASKAPEAPKLVLAVEEGFELQNMPIVSSFLGMFSTRQRGGGAS